MTKSLSYRPEIDGLRTVAVLSVIFYHFNIISLPGGFLGVDVFFVISGYLITAIILQQYQAKSFSIINFYESRVRRILPLFFLVFSVCSVLSYILFERSENLDIIESSIFAQLFLSNFYFWRTGGYFSSDAAEKMYLHTWSLSVEEQFYIIFPIILIFCLSRKININVVLILTILFSFLLAVYASNYHANASFFLLPTRAWELLVGGAAAWAVMENETIYNKRIFQIRKIDVGVILILASFLVINKSSFHPSWITLAPVAGTLLVLTDGSSSYVKTILSSKPMTTIGRISFGLYMWHYPILVFHNIYGFGLTSPLAKMALIVLTLIFSRLSYSLLETKLRNRTLSFKYVLLIITLLCVIGNYFNYLTTKSPNKDNPIMNLDLQNMTNATTDWNYPHSLVIDRNSEVDVGIMQTDKKIDTLIFGDSHAQHFAKAFVEKAENSDINLMFITEPGCPPLPSAYNKNYRKCDDLFQTLDTKLNEYPSVSKIIVSFCFTCYFYTNSIKNKKITQKEMERSFFVKDGDDYVSLMSDEGYKKAIEELYKFLKNISTNYEVILILGNPVDKRFDPDIIIKRQIISQHRLSLFEAKFEELNYSRFNISNEMYIANQRLIEKVSPLDVRVFSLYEIICPNFVCNGVSNNNFIFRDNNHLTYEFTKHLTDHALKNIFNGGK